MVKKEYAYGIIPIRKAEEGFEFFIVCHIKGHWGFPKGHSEGKEEPKRSAIRELNEETGLDILNFLAIDPIFETYTFERDGEKIEKVVTFFLAEVQGKISLQKKEIKQGRWVSLDEAIHLVSYEEGKRVAKEAKLAISSLIPLKG